MPGASAEERTVGRYALYDEIASGGMASVHVGRLMGPVGFSRTVAVKCLHPQFAKDPEFVAMFLDEARLAARIRHPNVVATIDVVALQGELFLVMEYVQGESLSRLAKAARTKGLAVPSPVVAAIVSDALYGLHSAHEARNERDEPLSIVHRDVSPQNIIVGADGVSRVLDFGIAKAASRVQTTREGQLKGKLSYMAPEQLTRGAIDRRTDIFSMSIVLWETLAGERLFSAADEGGTVTRILTEKVAAPSTVRPSLSAELDAVVLKGLARAPANRFATAKEMALALEHVLPPARPAQVAEWIERVAGDALSSRARRIAQIEGTTGGLAAKPARADTLTAATQLVSEVRSPALRGVPAPSGTAEDGLTELTASGSTDTPRSWRVLRRPALTLAVVAVFAVAVLTAGRYVTHRSPAAIKPEPAASSSVAPASATEGLAAQPSAVAPGITRADAPGGVASGAATSGSVAPVASAAPPVVTSPRSPASPAKKHTPDCDPPYYYDDDHVKRFKPACL
jgi:hypothetical protein